MENTTENEGDTEEEEEVIVYANFEEGAVSNDIFHQPELKFKVIGLDSDTPIVQLGTTTFKGTWNDIIGTKVFFEEDPSPEQVDPAFTVIPSKMLKFKCMSTKSLDLSRIFLKPKTAEDQGSDDFEVQMFNDTNNPVFGQQSEEIMNLVESTIKPDKNTNAVMNDIADSVMKVSE